MALEHDLDLLSRVALFADFPPEQLRLLAFGTERELLRAGRELYRQGDPSTGAHVVAGGQVDLVIFRGSREIVLDRVQEAGIIGELGLITPAHRVATAIARSSSEVMFIPRTLFHRMLNTFPETAAILHQRVSQSVLRMLKQLEKLHASLDAKPAAKG